MTPESTFVVPWQKVYTKRGDRLHDSHVHGDEVMTVEQILVESSNIGTITVSETMGFERQYHYMRQFGLGEKTALELPGRDARHPRSRGSSGRAPRSTPSPTARASPAARSSWSRPSTRSPTTASYVAPKLVKATVDADGEVREMPPSETHEVVRPEVAEQMQRMMREVVCRGTAKQARVPGLSIAGKTGTGFIAQPDGGYERADGTQGVLRQLRRLPARPRTRR